MNYGYVADVLAADNEWQDAYIFGVTEPVEVFEGDVVAVIHRLNDVEDKWVVAQPGTRPHRGGNSRPNGFCGALFQIRGAAESTLSINRDRLRSFRDPRGCILRVYMPRFGANIRPGMTAAERVQTLNRRSVERLIVLDRPQ